MIKTIIFDIDNTLYDYDYANQIALKAVYQYCFEQFGWESDQIDLELKCVQEEMIQKTGGSSSVIHNRLIRFQRFLERQKKPIFPYAMNLYHCYWDCLIQNMIKEPELQALFYKLKEKGYQIGIATDMTAYIQYKKLEALGIFPMIDFIVTSEEAGVEKPALAFYRQCIQKANCKPEECLMIGDSWKKDVQGAKNAGMQALWYHSKGAKTEKGQEVYILSSLKELIIKL